jgi:hypothetical protein
VHDLFTIYLSNLSANQHSSKKTTNPAIITWPPILGRNRPRYGGAKKIHAGGSAQIREALQHHFSRRFF